uniref:Uncharacterized protein n=1 Tax=Arundo donax TaxID=35708 RepID=A0A0A8ZLW7_ARUDO
MLDGKVFFKRSLLFVQSIRSKLLTWRVTTIRLGDLKEGSIMAQ